MLAYILMLNLINFGTEFYFQNILILHFNFQEKLLVIPSFHLIHLTMMQTNSPHESPYKTFRIGLHEKLINLTPLLTITWFSNVLLHCLDTHITF